MLSESNASKQSSGTGAGVGVGSMIEEVGTTVDDDDDIVVADEEGIDIVVVYGVSEVCLLELATTELVVWGIDVEVVITVLDGCMDDVVSVEATD